MGYVGVRWGLGGVSVGVRWGVTLIDECDIWS